MGWDLQVPGFSTLFAFVIGLVVGSFLNVCIYRLPRGENIVSPGSHCPSCLNPIKAWDNIPLLSFLLLKGRCRSCGAPISWRYPLVEGLTGIFFLLILYKFGLGFRSLLYLAFLSALVVVAFIDLEHQIIPHVITLPGIPVGLLSSLILREPVFFDSLAGALVGAGLLYFIAIYGELLLKKEAMGGGDVNLVAMVGAFLGWKKMLLTVFLGCLFGSVIGIGIILKRRKNTEHRAQSTEYRAQSTEYRTQNTEHRTRTMESTRIPFGPFLALGAAVSLFWGNDLIRWYLSILR